MDELEKLKKQNEKLKQENKILKIRIKSVSRLDRLMNDFNDELRLHIIEKNFNIEKVNKVINSVPKTVDETTSPEFQYMTRTLIYRFLIGADPVFSINQYKDENGNWIEPVSEALQCTLQAFDWINKHCPWWKLEELEYKNGKRRFILKPSKPLPLAPSTENSELDD
jgi:hypothetical protein